MNTDAQPETEIEGDATKTEDDALAIEEEFEGAPEEAEGIQPAACLCAGESILEDENDGRPAPTVAPSALLEGLSQLWTYPWHGIDRTREVLDGLIGNDALAEYRAGLESLDAALHAFDNAGEGIVGADAYQLEYTRLFIGSLKMYAPPYASFYVDGEQQVYGPTTVEIEDLFAQFGIELSENEHDMPDHIRFLVAFLAMLAKSYEEKGADDFAYAYRGFKEDYVDPWMGEFSAKVNEFAEFPFFKELLAFTLSVL